jgi:hypothetical protein
MIPAESHYWKGPTSGRAVHARAPSEQSSALPVTERASVAVVATSRFRPFAPTKSHFSVRSAHVPPHWFADTRAVPITDREFTWRAYKKSFRGLG